MTELDSLKRQLELVRTEQVRLGTRMSELEKEIVQTSHRAGDLEREMMETRDQLRLLDEQFAVFIGKLDAIVPSLAGLTEP